MMTKTQGLAIVVAIAGATALWLVRDESRTPSLASRVETQAPRSSGAPSGMSSTSGIEGPEEVGSALPARDPSKHRKSTRATASRRRAGSDEDHELSERNHRARRDESEEELDLAGTLARRTLIRTQVESLEAKVAEAETVGDTERARLMKIRLQHLRAMAARDEE